MRSRLSKWLGRRGIVIVYATAVLALLGILAVVVLDSGEPAMDADLSLVTTQLARYAADSGIEYALAVVDHELSKNARGFISPWADPTYTVPAYAQWLDPANGEGHVDLTPAFLAVPPGIAAHGAKWNDPSGTPVLGTPAAPVGPHDVENRASRFQLSADITLTSSVNPTYDLTDHSLSYGNVNLRVMFNQDAIFAVRSRGICRAGNDKTSVGSPTTMLQGYAVAVQKFRVGSLRQNNQPRLDRIQYELLPMDGPANMNRTPAAGNAQWTFTAGPAGFPAPVLLH